MASLLVDQRKGQTRGMASWMGLVLLLLLAASGLGEAGYTSRYVRRLQESIDLPLDSPHFAAPQGDNAPQQVHLTQGDYDGLAVIVSWITPKMSDPVVLYGTKNGSYPYEALGVVTRYRFYNYTSGFIHHATIHSLKHETQYFYKLGLGSSAREFWFVTPPKVGPNAAYTFGLIGDLGQTYDSAATLEHYMQSKAHTLLMVGDLSYADDYPFDDNVRWDTWGRLVERSTAYQPWIWTAGNHELEFRPELGEDVPFKPFTHRFHTPYKSSKSTSPLFYSIRRGPAHIIVLSSYAAYGKYTPQYVWLQAELQRVDRKATPWLIVLLHSPWYNSNTYHYMEGETMRVQFESWLVQAQVDVVFAGHVHSYERSHPVSNIVYNITNGICTPQLNPKAPVYITIGDGGNIEGLAGLFTEPQPQYSAFREASFGHGIFDILNRTHALWTWHRNQDGEAVHADSYTFQNKVWSK